MGRKVLVTASTFGHLVSFHLPYIRGLHNMGWDVDAACGGEMREIPGARRLIPLPVEKRMVSLKNLRAACILRRRIRQERYDLIIMHTTLAAFITRLSLFGVRDRPRTVNVVHGYLFDDETPRPKRFLLQTVERCFRGKTDVALTMNQYDYEWATRERAARTVESIPGMGVPAAADEALTEGGPVPPQKPAEAFIMVYAAEFSGRKNQVFLIRAMRSLPENVRLWLPGDGALRTRCESLAAELGVAGRIAFPGQVNNVGVWLRAADLAVSASRSEGLPFFVMEAMLRARPVVASAVKGNADLVDDGTTGLLYAWNDEDGFVRAVRTLMASGERRAQMGAAGAEKAVGFTLEKAYPIVMEQYLKAARRREAPAYTATV